MNCEIIRDLLPLYIDGICSKQTEEAVREHLETCADCQEVYRNMSQTIRTPKEPKTIPNEKAVYLRLRQNLGNFMLCCILLVAFVAIAFGVMNEVGNHGWPQGMFAIAFVIPGTAFMLSLLNFFFLREYPSRPWFCAATTLLSFLLCLGGDLFALIYYHFPEHWQDLIPFCIFIAVIFSLIEFLVARLYSRFCNR